MCSAGERDREHCAVAILEQETKFTRHQSHLRFNKQSHTSSKINTSFTATKTSKDCYTEAARPSQTPTTELNIHQYSTEMCQCYPSASPQNRIEATENKRA